MSMKIANISQTIFFQIKKKMNWIKNCFQKRKIIDCIKNVKNENKRKSILNPLCFLLNVYDKNNGFYLMAQFVNLRSGLRIKKPLSGFSKYLKCSELSLLVLGRIYTFIGEARGCPEKASKRENPKRIFGYQDLRNETRKWDPFR